MAIDTVVNNIQNKIRAVTRVAVAVLALPVVAALTITQALVIAPIFKKNVVIPNLIYAGVRKLLGYKIEFNKVSAPFVKDKPAWFVGNHLSIVDFLPFGGKVDGKFIGKGEILKWPVISLFAKAVKFIGLRRSSKYNAQSRAKIIENFNSGSNAIMFPEGTTIRGKKLGLFRAALLSVLFGDKGLDKDNKEVALNKDVVVQPIAMRVLSVDGKDALQDDRIHDLYAMHDEEGDLKRIWKRLQIKETVLELTVLKPLSPKDFSDEKALANQAALNIASIVNPGQTVFEKADIPQYKEKKKASL